jgi:hypothetical protein
MDTKIARLLILFLFLATLAAPDAVVRSYLPGPTENVDELYEQVPLLVHETSLVANPADYLPHDRPYARVNRVAPIYHTLADVRASRPFTEYGSGNRWAVVHNQAEVDGRRYSRISWGWAAEGWVAADALSYTASLSRLRGIDIRERGDEHLAMVYHEALNVRSEPGVITEETVLGQLDRYSLISVREQRVVNGARWYRIGPNQWINSFYVRNFWPGNRPAAVGADEKWIEVNLRQQTLIAHEGDTPVFATLVSTGRRDYETETGLYRIWLKYQLAPMTWTDAVPPYSLASVPWIAYFNRGQGLHGVYWHDNYGTVRSAGCVNMSPHDAHWIFHWSSPPLPDGRRTVQPTAETPGTWVWVH